MDPRATSRFHLHLGRLAATAVPSWADCVTRSPRSAAGTASDGRHAPTAHAGTPGGAADSIRECVTPIVASLCPPAPLSG